MAEITKELGRIPVSRGDYQATIEYYKDNIVQYKRGSYQVVSESPIIGVPPTNDKNVVNPGWTLFAGTLDAQDVVNQIKEQEIKSIQAVAAREAEILAKSDASKISSTTEGLEGDNVQENLNDAVFNIQSIKNYSAKEQNIVNNPTGEVNKVYKIDGTKATADDYTLVAPIALAPEETILLNKGSIVYNGYQVALLFKCDSQGNFTELIEGRATLDEEGDKYCKYTNKSKGAIYIGTSTYTNQRSYTIEKLANAAPLSELDKYLKIDRSPLSETDAKKVLANINAASLYNFGYASMSSPADSVDKTISKPGYVLDANTILVVCLCSTNTANSLTLNVNNTGAKPLYYNGERASSSNCWQANEKAILITTTTEYYLYSVSNWQIKSLIAKIGISNNEIWNYFLKELYLTGLDKNETYYLSTVRKDTASSRWGLYINKTDAYSMDYAVAVVYLTEEKNFVEVVERNNSGINGYAIVNWDAVTTEGYTSLYDYVKLRNDIISKIEFNPNIYSHLKDKEQDNSINIISKDVQNAINNIQKLENEVHLLGGNSSDVTNMILESKIREERPYFLDADWSNATSYENDSYLNEKINSIPEGKHFIFTTDSHIDYYNVGLAQKDTEIMAYVKSKIGGCVIFGGDCIGQQDTEFKAARVLSVYANDKFNAFGADFLWCQGNHDANFNDGQNQLKSSEIYKRTTKQMEAFGKVVFDDEGLAIIESCGLSSENSEEAKAWMNLHYYYDDNESKIRFIVLETGDGSNGAGIVGNTWDGYESLSGYITFVGKALKTTPNGYNVVVVMHQLLPEESFVDGGETASTLPRKGVASLFELLKAYNTKSTVTITGDGSVSQSSKPVLYKLINDRIGNGVVYDFSQISAKKAFIISGHYHLDDAFVFQKTDASSAWRYVGKEYSLIDTMPANSILAIIQDRAALWDVGSWAGSAKMPNAVSYPAQSIDGQAGGEMRRGTKNEVLFDVVTLTTDNKVICTRIGAGEDRSFNLP